MVFYRICLCKPHRRKGIAIERERALHTLPFTAKGRGQLKKNFFFRALPELPKPPPPSPQFGQLGPLFSDVKIQDLKVSLELKILYILYDILYNAT